MHFSILLGLTVFLLIPWRSQALGFGGCGKYIRLGPGSQWALIFSTLTIYRPLHELPPSEKRRFYAQAVSSTGLGYKYRHLEGCLA